MLNTVRSRYQHDVTDGSLRPSRHQHMVVTEGPFRHHCMGTLSEAAENVPLEFQPPDRWLETHRFTHSVCTVYESKSKSKLR
jgi:hypothetical protein